MNGRSKVTTLDLILLIVLGAGIVHGIWKGFIKGIFDIIALLAGIIGAYLIIKAALNLPVVIRILIFIISFIAIVSFIRFLGWLLTKVLDIFPLNLMNRLLGGLLGFIKAALVFWIFLFIYFLSAPNYARDNIGRSPLSSTLWQGGLYVVKLLTQERNEGIKERPGEHHKRKPGLRRVVASFFKQV